MAEGQPKTELAHYRRYAAVTPSDSTTYGTRWDTRKPIIDALYIGVAGDVALVGDDGAAAVTFKSVPVGLLAVNPYRVMATNTTATNILALFR